MDLDSLHNMSDTGTWFVCKKMMRWPAPQDPCSQGALARANGLPRISAEPVTEDSRRPAVASVKPGDREAAAGAGPPRGTRRDPDATWHCWVSLFGCHALARCQTCLLLRIISATITLDPCQRDDAEDVTVTIGKGA